MVITEYPCLYSQQSRYYRPGLSDALPVPHTVSRTHVQGHRLGAPSLLHSHRLQRRNETASPGVSGVCPVSGVLVSLSQGILRLGPLPVLLLNYAIVKRYRISIDNYYKMSLFIFMKPTDANWTSTMRSQAIAHYLKKHSM